MSANQEEMEHCMFGQLREHQTREDPSALSITEPRSPRVRGWAEASFAQLGRGEN